MRKPLFAIMLVLVTALTVADNVHAQRRRFTAIAGSNLQAKLDTAISRGRAGQARFWAAYSFDARPFVADDLEFRDVRHNMRGINLTFSVEGVPVDPYNPSVFILYEPDGNTIARVGLFNLDRQREYSEYRIYWMGRAANEESLNFLKGLADSPQATNVAKTAIVALSLHDDPRITGMIEDFAHHAKTEDVRSTAVFWLAHIPGSHPYLAELVHNEKESTELRRQAVFALGVGSDPSAVATLQSLYASVNTLQVKTDILFAASITHLEGGSRKNDDENVSFLIKVAERETDRVLKRDAIWWLGYKAGQRALDVLSKMVENYNADTETQKNAVAGISQRSKDEAVPLLIKIARTHTKPEVRKAAIFWLGQSQDPDATKLPEEILK